MKEASMTDNIRFTLNGVAVEGEGLRRRGGTGDGGPRGEGGLRNLVRTQAWQVLDAECGDPGILTDLDTPGYYERALSARHHHLQTMFSPVKGKKP